MSQKNRLIIRDTGISILDILKGISRGQSYREIIDAYPLLTIDDIKYAGDVALDIIHKNLINDYLHLAGCSKYYQKKKDFHILTGRDWSKEDKKEIIKLFQNKVAVKHIARLLLRDQSDILLLLKVSKNKL